MLLQKSQNLLLSEEVLPQPFFFIYTSLEEKRGKKIKKNEKNLIFKNSNQSSLEIQWDFLTQLAVLVVKTADKEFNNNKKSVTI